jgi:DNA repair protein RadA/Sms
MARVRTVFACSECGAQQPKWMGRCPECGAWSSLSEERQGAAPAPGVDPLLDSGLLGGAPVAGAKLQRLSEVDAAGLPRLGTGIPELDRVLGGGLVPGSVVLLAGEPGVGKSTLALQLAAGLEQGPVLYVSGEESPEQIRLRADRLPELPERLAVLAETQLEALAAPWRELGPALVVVDSVQTLRSDRVESAPGSVSQVRECAAWLAAAAKRQGAALVLVGHVTKDGSIAGPRVLEHLVDVVLQFEGDRGHAFRLLRAHKNRFGSTQEVGVFHMTTGGLETVANPSELFLAERRGGAPGSCIAPIVEGTRPMLVEIQALVAPARWAACAWASPLPTWPWRWRSPRAVSTCRCPPTWRPAARSGSGARCDGWRAATCGCARRCGSASGACCCPSGRPARRRRERPRSRWRTWRTRSAGCASPDRFTAARTRVN